jgi:hypothetical protein
MREISNILGIPSLFPYCLLCLHVPNLLVVPLNSLDEMFPLHFGRFLGSQFGHYVGPFFT